MGSADNTGSGVGHSRCDILNQTPNLVHSRLDLTPGPLTTNSNPLTRLQSLEMNLSAMRLLAELTLPALRCVEIFNSTCGGAEVLDLGNLDDLHRCVSRSGCSLQKLHITAGRDRPLTLDICRGQFPSIPTLLFDVKGKKTESGI
jgi:hypothetical protein